MHIAHLTIKNFRALDDIQTDLTPRINVIVGPNAIGKTTILQALRLAKGVLAPRTQGESQQILYSLGAASPNLPERFLTNALFRDEAKPLEIRCTFRLTDKEIETLEQAPQEIARSLVQARLGQAFANPTALMRFLNSPVAQQELSVATKEIDKGLAALRKNKTVVLGITIQASGESNAHNVANSMFVSFLERALPLQLTLFSYFPADRAMPMSEGLVNIGGFDIHQQLESHNARPQLKYERLKNTIFSTVIRGDTDRKRLAVEFDRIFAQLLPGRHIVDPGINDIGMLSIQIEENDTHSRFEFDNLSSGEKGLILTFLLISQTVSAGGIVLLDEPELHLNPAVCKGILQFLFESYSQPQDIQFIICSHSPEVLQSAFDRDEYALYHLLSESLITKVGRTALDELSDALERLGTSVSENLLYRGTVMVEGDDDVKLLEEGFSEVLRRYQIRARGGRQNIEETVGRLQSLEKRGDTVDPIFLIFDRDDKPTSLESSSKVRLLQWQRYCLENYLLDLDVITELLKKPDIARQPIKNAAQVEKLLREIAFSQIDEIAARRVYPTLGYLSPSLRAEDVASKISKPAKSLAEIAEALFLRLSDARDSLPNTSQSKWKTEFIAKCEVERKSIVEAWEMNWKEQCNGKLLFARFQAMNKLRVSSVTFKRRIMQQMKVSNSENWRHVAGLLRDLVGSK